MARTAEDCIGMMKILANNPSKLRLDAPINFCTLKVFFCDHEGASYVSAIQPEVRKQVHRVVDFFRHDLKVRVRLFYCLKVLTNDFLYFACWKLRR